MHALAEGQANTGNEREPFFFNQLSKKHVVTSPPYGDFKIDDTYLFEVGGKGNHKNKSANQQTPTLWLMTWKPEREIKFLCGFLAFCIERELRKH